MATIKDLKRMCCSIEDCGKCPLEATCESAFPMTSFPDNADEIVDKWVKEHPIKTYLRDLKSKFPKITDPTYIYNNVCRDLLYSSKFPECGNTHNCMACWNEEMKEE